MWPAQLGNQRPMCHFTQTAMHNTWWCWIRGDKSEPILLTFFWCLDTKTYKKYISILTLEDSKKFDRKFGKRTINYYEFPVYEKTLSESSKSPYFLLFTHEGDNFHLSNFSLKKRSCQNMPLNSILCSWKSRRIQSRLIMWCFSKKWL